jgi:hypothetical protein
MKPYFPFHNSSFLIQHLSLRLPFWHRQDIAMELASHFQEMMAEMAAQGKTEDEAEAAARQRFGELGGVSESLQAIHQGWIGGATVQQRSVTFISLVVMLFCVLAVPLVPPLRDFARMLIKEVKSSQPLPTQQEAQAAARKLSKSAVTQIALIELAHDNNQIKQFNKGNFSDNFNANEIASLRSVVNTYPKSAAAHLAMAEGLLDASGFIDREELNFSRPAPGDYVAPPRSKTQWAYLEEARRELKTASTLAPDNAALAYLYAYACFDAKDDAKGNITLEETKKKTFWDFYGQETENAIIALVEASGRSLVSYYPGSSGGRLADLGGRKLHELLRLLTAFAEKERRAGQTEKAIFRYEQAMQLSERMAADVHTSFECTTLVQEVSSISIHFVTPAESAPVRKLRANSPERKRQVEQLRELGTRKFIAYLTAAGRQDLAQRYMHDLQHAQELGTKANKEIYAGSVKFHNSFVSPALVLTFADGVLIAWVIGLLIVIGIVSLLARAWAAAGTAPFWHWWEWAVMLLFCFIPIGLVFAAMIDHDNTNGRIVSSHNLLALALGLLEAGLLLIILPLVIALLKRRRQPVEIRMGKFQAILASYRTLLPPTFALLLLLALALAIPAQLRLQSWTKQQKQIIQVGEVQYWGDK